MKEKIKKSKELLRDLEDEFAVIAWTGGKDSTVILHLVRDLFGDIPERWLVFINDTGDMFEEQQEFIDYLTIEWDLPIVLMVQSDKVKAIDHFIKQYNPKYLISGIRKDEHKARANEKHISERENHTRIHPILDWTEDDIWKYIEEHNVPYCSLYDEGYRSLGEASKTEPVSPDEPERAGRELKKEEVMDELRKAGYW